MVAFALPVAGCVNMQAREIALPLAAAPAAQGLAPGKKWWVTTGDPVLARLVAQGLSGSAPLACDAAALSARRSPGIAGARRTRSGPSEASYAYLDHRARVAAAIAHAYVDVRKWQALLALRQGALDQYRDNAEIARFRYEAGLVSATDGGLAGAVSALNDSARDRARARLDAYLVVLSALTGMASDDVNAQLAEVAAIPDIGLLPAVSNSSPPDISARADLLALKAHLERRLVREKITQASLDRAVLNPVASAQPSPAQTAVAAWHRALAAAETEIRTLAGTVAVADAELQTLPRREALARRAVADARLAYRAGAGDFATLFVAEVAALGVQEALVEARADRARAMIDLRTARGEGWDPADAAPAAITAAAARKGADCE